MIRFNLSIRELFIIFIIFLCYCVFVFYNTRNIKENFAVEKGVECVDIVDDKAKCNNNPNCMVVSEVPPIVITVESIINDSETITLSTKPQLQIGDKIDITQLPAGGTIEDNTVIKNITKDASTTHTITLSKKIKVNDNDTLTFIRSICTDNSRKECSAFATDKNCKLADHCNWNEGLNPPKCETNCGSYNYESCNVNSVCKWDDTRSSCRFDCSKAYASEATCDVVDARCQWNNDNNTCQNRSAFHCAQHGNQWECNYNEQCEWNAKPTDGRTPRCDYKNCETIEDKDKCDKMDERCEWDNNNNKCTTTPGYSEKGGIDDTRLDYFEKQKANFKIHQIFCDRLKRLDKPNKNNLIFKRFTKDFIDNKKKHVKILEDKIQNFHKRQHEIDTYNYNINKIREHDQASKQVAAIKKGIENIKNKNKIKINLE